MAKVTVKSFPVDTGEKVAGIKRIRALYGVGLKEAKEVIEGLMMKPPREYVDEAVNDKVKRREAIADLRGYGAVVECQAEDGALVEQIRAAAHTALDVDELEVANMLVDILKRIS